MELNIKLIARGNPDVCTLTSGLPTKLVWTTLRSCFAPEELKSPINKAVRDLLELLKQTIKVQNQF